MTRAPQPELCHALMEIGLAFGYGVQSHGHETTIMPTAFGWLQLGFGPEYRVTAIHA